MMHHTPSHCEHEATRKHKASNIPEGLPFPAFDYLDAPRFSKLIVMPQQNFAESVGGYTSQAGFCTSAALWAVPELEQSVAVQWWDQFYGLW
jgi:hypothetical protein